MKYLYKIFFLILIFFVNAQAQTVSWQKWYDYGTNYNEGEDVVQTFDGGYLFLGINYLSSANGTFLTKTNQYGTIEWQRLLTETVTGGLGIVCFSIQQAKDSGFVLSGYGIDSACLIKTNKDGILIWIKKYSKFGKEARFFDHKITIDGGIIACGDLYPPSVGYAVKTDSYGNVEWDSIYNNTFVRVIQSSDSCFYFGRSYGLLKTSKIGRVIWEKFFQQGGPSVMEDNKGFIFTGGSAGISSMYLGKFDTFGTQIWGKSFYPGAVCQTMCLSVEGNILMAGYIDSIVQAIITVVKVNTEGDLIFNKQIFSATGNNLSFLPFSVKATNDFGFILTGFTNYPPFTIFKDNVLAVKTDSQCNSPKIVGISENSSIAQTDFILNQNYPNPFNPETKINFTIPKSGKVTLKIYDVLGNEVRTLVNEFRNAGSYLVTFEGMNLPSGVYYYKMESGNFMQVRKMVLIK